MLGRKRFRHRFSAAYRIAFLVTVLLLAESATTRAQFTVLHSFNGTDGAYANGSLTMFGSTIYGTTGGNGGDTTFGTIFRMNADGSGYQVLHSFNGSDGADPVDSVALCGSTLYGMTQFGGSNGIGTVFAMNTDGSGYQILHSFNGSDGERPLGSLTLSGSALYGMTSGYGSAGYGTVFAMNTDGSGFQVLHNFTGGSSDGGNPYGSLTLSGSTLYGMTYTWSTIFKVNLDGTGYQVLHHFSYSDGIDPFGELTVSGSTLYGMASAGDGVAGTVFAMNTDGSGFQVLHNFMGGTSDGAFPVGSLTLSGSTLYGMTNNGGSNDVGTVFQMNVDGTAFKLLHIFTGSDGEYPDDLLALSGSTLYGLAENGGAYGYGTAFALAIPSVVLDPNTFRITSVAQEGNDLRVTWLMGPGQTNTLQAAAGNSSGGYSTNDFSDIFIVTNNPTAGTVTNYLDVGAATNGPSRYYRARLVP